MKEYQELTKRVPVYIGLSTFAELIDRNREAAGKHIRSKEFRHCIRQDFPGAKIEINWPEYVRTKETQCVPYPKKNYI